MRPALLAALASLAVFASACAPALGAGEPLAPSRAASDAVRPPLYDRQAARAVPARREELAGCRQCGF